MPSPPVIDLDLLLQPIPGTAPAGEDLREDLSHDSLYYRIKDARAAARAAERVLEAQDEQAGGSPDEWRLVVKLAPEALGKRSKDLEVVAWLIEALVRTAGFAGLRDGFLLAAGLVEGFWDGVYPRPDEDGVATTVAPLSGLNGTEGEGTLIQPIRRVPLTRGNDGAYALWEFEQANDLSRQPPDRAERRIAAGALTLERFEASARATPPAVFRTLFDDLEGAIAAFERLMAVLETAAGADAPPASNIRTALGAVRDAVRFVGRDALAATAPVAAAEVAEAAEGADSGAPGGAVATATRTVPTAGAIRNREDAFRELLRIATFFRETEPHSPISYTLEDAVRRGRLSLPELLAELVTDAAVRKEYLRTAGIRPPAE